MIKCLIIIIIIILLYFIILSPRIEHLTDKTYFFYVSKSPNLYCTHNIHERTVGYISDIDKDFINAIGKSYRIKPLKLVKLNPIVPIFDSVDFAIVSVTKNSNIFKVISDFDLFIYSFDTIDIDRMKIFMNNIKQSNIDIKQFWNFNKKINTENTTVLYINTRETFITRLIRDPEVEDNNYHCYGDIQNLNKQLCNMPYDPFGNIKKKETIWDKPCEKNEDCPFYGKNKHHQIDRGKCVDKYCELPVGVRRISYTKYDDVDSVNKPFCHNTDECTDDSDYIFA
jgi:hypothetical protein|tara:strand:+ start:1500 stop:2348 length:849 start_codon:yes stop_codon:yes gene_type:complete